VVHSSFTKSVEKRASRTESVSVGGKIEEFEGRILRVITLDDKVTIPNAFPDRGFKP
jgi:hypothetical protein